MGKTSYKAFISYSHQDRKWGAWLQRAIESYRVPGRLVGTEAEFGKVPRRLTPVFRDREDLSTASDLSAKVKGSLGASEALIVVCSPAAAQSDWVNEEINHFKSLGRADRVFALIVDGDPQSADAREQCFPSALVNDPDGSVREPLAADVRKWADGRLLARLKIIAGLLGLPLDALRRRDMQRRQRFWAASLTGAVAIALIMAVLAVMAITARNAAENRREHAENLVGYMVGDLRSKLQEVGRLDILEGMGGKVSEYLETLDPEEVTDASLIQQARVWRQLGEVSMDQGRLDEALRAFTASRDVLAELHRRNPGNSENLFELGNAEFWVAYVFLEQGEFELAESSFGAYLGYAYQLADLEPGRPSWLMEQSYAHSNMAALIVRRQGANAEAALHHIRMAADFNRQAMDQMPENLDYKSNYGEVLAWLADSQLLVCDLGGALLSRQQNVKISGELLADSPANASLKRRHAYALSGLAWVAEQVGLVDTAIENYAKSRALLSQLYELEPTNLDARFEYLRRESILARLSGESGNLDEALGRLQGVTEPFARALEMGSHDNLDRYLAWVRHLLNTSELAWRAGEEQLAQDLLRKAIDHLGKLYERDGAEKALLTELLAARFIFWQQNGMDLFESPPFNRLEQQFDSESGSCSRQAILVRQAILSGDGKTAADLTRNLLGKGYYEPGFIRVCRQYALCQDGESGPLIE